MDSVLKFNSGNTEILLDTQSGSILQIKDSSKELCILNTPLDRQKNRRLFKIVVPNNECFSRYASNNEQACPKIEQSRNQIMIQFQNVSAGGETTGIAVKIIIEKAANDEIIFVLQVENSGPYDVTDILFPWIAGWNGIGGAGKDKGTWVGRDCFDTHTFLPVPHVPTYANFNQRSSAYYPANVYLPWIDLSGPQEGISYINYMQEGLNSYISFENLPEYARKQEKCLAFGWGYQAVVSPGETWTSPRVGISIHAGDWHHTANRYRTWYEQNLKLCNTPDSARKTIGFQNVFFRGFDGTKIRDYSQISQVAKIGLKYDMEHLSIWDYLPLGNYSKHSPYDLMDYTDSEKEAISRGLHQARQTGVQVSALVNFRHPNVPARFHSPDLFQQVKKRYDGTPVTENWSAGHNYGSAWIKHLGPESYVYSPFVAEYRERVLRITREYMDIGFTSMFYDQPWELFADYGAMDKGYKPEQTHAETVKLIGEVASLIKNNDTEAIMIGEECDIFGGKWINMWMSWGFSDINKTAVSKAEILRYSFPHAMISWVVDSEIDRTSLAFALGMYICLCMHGNEATMDQEPILSEHIARLAKLRKKCAERTVLARFNDKCGLEVSGDDGFYAYSYDSKQGPSVIAAAVGNKVSGKVTVDRNAFSAPGNQKGGVLYGLDGSKKKVTGDTLEFILNANEVSVWIL